MDLEQLKIVLHQRCECAWGMERFFEVIQICRQRVLIDPTDAHAWYRIGLSFYEIRQYQEAIEAYERATPLNHPFWSTCAHWHQAYPHLITGDLRQGFEHHETRLKIFSKYPLLTNRPTKIWQGEDISGKTLLIHYDGGLGDTIQFLRYIPLIKKLSCRLLLCLQQELQCLFGYLGIPFIDEASAQKWDVHAFVDSLAYCLKTTEFSHIPPPIQIPCRRLPVKKRIAITWRSGTCSVDGRRRMIPLSQFEPLLTIPGYTYVCIQKEISQEEALFLEKYGVERPPIHSFLDTLKILEQCERVISTDTSVIHLSASMGIPTWVILPSVANWTWFLHHSESPWYPSVRLFRQVIENNWQMPLQRIKLELQQ